MSIRIAAAIILIAFTSAAAADEPKTMGRCGPAQKKGDECALGVCYSGKQTIYVCAEDKTCTKSDKQKNCAAT
jgi:hypothetical protein